MQAAHAQGSLIQKADVEVVMSELQHRSVRNTAQLAGARTCSLGKVWAKRIEHLSTVSLVLWLNLRAWSLVSIPCHPRLNRMLVLQEAAEEMLLHEPSAVCATTVEHLGVKRQRVYRRAAGHEPCFPCLVHIIAEGKATLARY